MATILPKNLQLIAQRLSNFHRTTVRTRAQSNDVASAGQTVTFRLPTNTLVDLHCLQIYAEMQISNTIPLPSATASTSAVPTNFSANGITMLAGPRSAQSLIERLDIVINGQVVNGSNNDYGGLLSLLTNHLSTNQRTNTMGFLESGDNKLDSTYSLAVRTATQAENFVSSLYCLPIIPTAAAPYTNAVPSLVNYQVPNNSKPLSMNTSGNAPGSYTVPVVMNGFMGFLAGNFVRFVDTAVLGPVEIRIRLAPGCVMYGCDNTVNNSTTAVSGSVLPYTAAVGATTTSNVNNRPSSFNYKLQNMYLILDTISFTDDFYRAILAKRLIDGGVITIPYQNVFSFQKNVGLSDTVSFNLATQSLDYLIGTFRDQRYSSNCIKKFSTDANDSSYYKFSSCAGSNLINSTTTYQFLVNNMYAPTWPANVNEAALLTRAAWDLANDASGVGRIDQSSKWRNGMFAFVQSFNHHAEADKMISGLDTRGASSNMQFMFSGLIPATGQVTYDANGVCYMTNYYAGSTDEYIYDSFQHGAQSGCAAIVWALTTSTLEISAGQNIVVIF